MYKRQRIGFMLRYEMPVVYHLLVNGILQHLCLLGGHVAGADAARGNGKQQGDACSERCV